MSNNETAKSNLLPCYSVKLLLILNHQYKFVIRLFNNVYSAGASKPAQIIPFLYLGNERDSSDLTLLRKLGVSKVYIAIID